MRKAKIGIVGCGIISYFGYAPAYLSLDGAEIYAVCDAIEERAKRAASEWGAQVSYTNYEDLLKDKNVDAVDICLPHNLHATFAIKAAEAGKHVAVQKPIAVTIKQVDDMIRACRNANVKLAVDECEIFYPPNVEAKKLMDLGEIGEPVMIQMSRLFGTYDPSILERRFGGFLRSVGHGDRNEVGGPFIDGTWHALHVAYHLLGNVEEVSAWINVDSPDEMPFVLKWKYEKNGRFGMLGGCKLPGVYIPCDLYPVTTLTQIDGSEGIIWINRCEGQIVNTAPLTLHKGKAPGKTIYFDNIRDNYLEGFKEMKREWVKCILEDEKPRATGEDGQKVLQFLLAAYKSAKEGTPVKTASVTDWDWKTYY